MDDVAFDGFYIVGDFMNMEPISHWLKNKKKTLEGKRMKEDYIRGNALLDEFDINQAAAQLAAAFEDFHTKCTKG